MSAVNELASAVAPSPSPIPVCAQQALREQISKFAPNCSLAPALTPTEAEDLLGSLSSGSLPALEESLTSSGHTTPPSHNTMATNDFHEFGDSPFRAPLEDEGEGGDGWSTGGPSLLFPPTYEQRSEEVEPAHSNTAPIRPIDVVALRAVLEELLAKQRNQITSHTTRDQSAEGTSPMNHPYHTQGQGQSPGHPRRRQQQQHSGPYPNSNTNIRGLHRAEFVQREARTAESGRQGAPQAGSYPVADHGYTTPYTTPQGLATNPGPSGPPQLPQASGASLEAAKLVLQALLKDRQPARSNDPPSSDALAQGPTGAGRGVIYPEWPPVSIRQQQHEQYPHQYQEQQGHHHGYASPHPNAPPQGLGSGPFPVGNTNGPKRGQQEPREEMGGALVRLFLSFPMDVPLREVKKMCSRYGAIHSVRALRPTRPPRAKNCAFVNFYHHSDAQKVVDAVSHAHGVRLEGLEGRVQCRIADAANWPAPRSARKGQPEGGRRRPQPNSRGHGSAQGV